MAELRLDVKMSVGVSRVLANSHVAAGYKSISTMIRTFAVSINCVRDAYNIIIQI